MADRVAVMSDGGVEQLCTPQTVYNRPSSQFCAHFLGNANIVEGVVAGGEPGAWQIEEGERRWHSQSAEQWEAGRRVAIVMRAEHFIVLDEAEPTGVNHVEGPVNTVDYKGDRKGAV